MPLFDDDAPHKAKGPRIGADLSDLSMEEIEDWIAAYRAEIARLEAKLAEKRRSRDAAHSVFKI